MHTVEQVHSLKCAEIHSSLFNKTSIPQSSLLSKFSTLQLHLSSLQNDIQKISSQIDISTKMLAVMKNELYDKELKSEEEKLMDEIKKLDKLIKYGCAERKTRTERIWINCKQRIDRTEKMKDSMKEIHERLVRIEKTLG